MRHSSVKIRNIWMVLSSLHIYVYLHTYTYFHTLPALTLALHLCVDRDSDSDSDLSLEDDQSGSYASTHSSDSEDEEGPLPPEECWESLASSVGKRPQANGTKSSIWTFMFYHCIQVTMIFWTIIRKKEIFEKIQMIIKQNTQLSESIAFLLSRQTEYVSYSHS